MKVDEGGGVGRVDSLRGLRISKWIIDVRNKRRQADIPPKKPEAVLPGANCLLLKNKTLIQQPGMGN